jgi:hypothetical protein
VNARPEPPRPAEGPGPACSLDGAALAVRKQEIAVLAGDALLERQPADNGVRFRFRPDAESEVRDLVAREQVCCPFLDFRIEVAGDVILEVTGSPDVQPLIAQLLA